MTIRKEKFICRYVHSTKAKHKQQVCHLQYLLSKSIPISEEQKALVNAAPLPNFPCGGRTTHSNKSTHFKSPGHQRYLALLSDRYISNPDVSSLQEHIYFQPCSNHCVLLASKGLLRHSFF